MDLGLWEEDQHTNKTLELGFSPLANEAWWLLISPFVREAESRCA